MNILFVRNYPSVDGVFTLILRLAKQFKQDGHTPYFINFGGKTDFEKDIKETFILLNFEDVNAKINLPHVDIIFLFVGGEVLYWSINYLKHELFKNAKVVMGAFHPRAYFESTYIGPTPDTRLHKLILENFPAENILFMNEVVKRDHENYFNIKFKKSLIVPLPVKLNNKLRDLSKVDRKKIVSISRLENSKGYVLPMIDVIEELHNEGHEFEFYIYGHGQLEKYIEKYIAKKKLGQYIFLMGTLDYKKLYQVLEDAFMFVGMGTSIIEASSIGVPSLQAYFCENRSVTYGFFDKLSGFCIGEVIPELPLINMKDSIIELSKRNELEYQQICRAHITRANTFNIDLVIKQYYSFFSNASNVFKFRISDFNQIITKLLRQVFKAKFLTRPEFRSK